MSLLGIRPTGWSLSDNTIITPTGVLFRWTLIFDFFSRAVAFLRHPDFRQIADTMEATQAFISHLPQPTRSQPLAELLETDLNTRENTMPPPAIPHGRKHTLTNLPEPAPKRKTLAERGGEPYASGRNLSHTSSVAGRSFSNASARSVSHSSFTTSHGSGIRAPSAMQSLARPKTTLYKSKNGKVADTRRAAAMADVEVAEGSFTTQMWDPEAFSSNMERMYQDMCAKMDQTAEETKESAAVYRSQIQKLEQERALSTEKVIELQTTLNETKHRLVSAQYAKERIQKEHEDLQKAYEVKLAETSENHLHELKESKKIYEVELAHARQQYDMELRESKKAYEVELQAKDDEIHILVAEQRVAKATFEAELSRIRQDHAAELSMKLNNADVGKVQLEANHRAEMQRLQQAVDQETAKLDLQRTMNHTLNQTITSLTANANAMEHAQRSLQAKIDYLESDSKSQSEAYAEMEKRMRDAIDKADRLEEELRQQESMRRRLHNQVLELKGNIRVFCRIRPHIGGESDEKARITFPEAEEPTEIEVKGPEEKNSLGMVTTKKHPFTFDRVFNPASNNTEIFNEISQLIQSALDGYNVCIFAYGQTGSGKTYTMSSEDGMIPRALRQIYSTSESLKERGWAYTMEGSFVEVYNEDINDLLSQADDSHKKKHEIKHDVQKLETTITDVTTVDLNSPEMVDSILERAMAKRSVAATKANEHSSRSHSVFILKLVGHNHITGEHSRGTLNLVDLAGSERLSQSKAEGVRLKETQSINKSLSSLGDVIGALGQKGDGGHVPYRNSKLTYLLQFSLGGNSKTLMFVMVSPLKEHLGETLCSLKFAAKVHSTHIGVAKKAAK